MELLYLIFPLQFVWISSVTLLSSADEVTPVESGFRRQLEVPSKESYYGEEVVVPGHGIDDIGGRKKKGGRRQAAGMQLAQLAQATKSIKHELERQGAVQQQLAEQLAAQQHKPQKGGKMVKVVKEVPPHKASKEEHKHYHYHYDSEPLEDKAPQPPQKAFSYKMMPVLDLTKMEDKKLFKKKGGNHGDHGSPVFTNELMPVLDIEPLDIRPPAKHAVPYSHPQHYPPPQKENLYHKDAYYQHQNKEGYADGVPQYAHPQQHKHEVPYAVQPQEGSKEYAVPQDYKKTYSTNYNPVNNLDPYYQSLNPSQSKRAV